jgi:Sulfotransferase domain
MRVALKLRDVFSERTREGFPARFPMLPVHTFLDAPARRLPDTLFVGPRRAGTTWIHEYLAARGDVGLPRSVKETNFFDLHFDRGRAWYARFFPAREATRVVEVAPSYFLSADAPARVVDVLGRVRIVCTLRDPVERTHSLWVHMRRYGMTKLCFRDALDALPVLIDGSRYATHLRRWQAAVGRERVHVLLMEHLRENASAFADAVSRTLEIEPRPLPARLASRVNEGSLPRFHQLARIGWRSSRALRSAGLHEVVNVAKRVGLQPLFFGSPGARKPSPPTDEERARIRNSLHDEIEGVEALTGLDLARWKR